MPIIKLTPENFDEKVLKAPGKILVDFNATWCGPCQMQAPILEELADNYQIASLDIDDAPELAEEYGVRSIPCLVLFENGKEQKRKVGLTPAPAIKKLLGA